MSLRVDVDTILDMRVPEPEASPLVHNKDRMLVAQFTTSTPLLCRQPEHSKRHRSR